MGRGWSGVSGSDEAIGVWGDLRSLAPQQRQSAVGITRINALKARFQQASAHKDENQHALTETRLSAARAKRLHSCVGLC